MSEWLLGTEVLDGSSSAIIAPIHSSVVGVGAGVELKAWITFELVSTSVTVPVVSIESWASFFDYMTLWANYHRDVESSKNSES